MMSYLLILAGLLFSECETTAAVETYTYSNVGQNDKAFTEDVLFESPARSLNCARQCNQDESCVTFTIDQGICRGHAVLVTSNTPAVAAPGAQSFAKSNYITKAIRPKDCVEVKHSMQHESGVVTIYPEDNSPLKVYCDQDTDGGGWLVFQRRQNGSVDFFRNWTEYQTGFGDLLGEFWLGLDALRLLTSSQSYELRVDLMSFEGMEGNATYSNFNISDSSDGYRLGFDNFTGGSAGDSLQFNNGEQFYVWNLNSTNTSHGTCFKNPQGSWWGWHTYADVNLNGHYKSNRTIALDGLWWYSFDFCHSLKFSELKVRPM